MENPKDNTAMLIVAERIGLLHEDITELKHSMKDSMEKVTEAVTQLVRLEVQQQNMNLNYERMSKQLEKSEDKFSKLEERVDAIEKEQPMQKTITNWVIAGITGMVGIMATIAVKFFGFG